MSGKWNCILHNINSQRYIENDIETETHSLYRKREKIDTWSQKDSKKKGGIEIERRKEWETERQSLRLLDRERYMFMNRKTEKQRETTDKDRDKWKKKSNKKS